MQLKHPPIDSFGRGFPVILIHGFLEDRKIWDWLMKSATDGYNFLTYDLSGHGENKDFQRVLSMESEAERILQFIDEKKFDKVVLVGHSMG